ncbi:MAG: hypothetical protein KAI98_07075, partial [Gemmatimonadetes bacterium]|nr:hypothetical protein [Gemmatimonadota bacterium]
PLDFDCPVALVPAGERGDLSLAAADGAADRLTELSRRNTEGLERDLNLDSVHDCVAPVVKRPGLALWDR